MSESVSGDGPKNKQLKIDYESITKTSDLNTAPENQRLELNVGELPITQPEPEAAANNDDHLPHGEPSSNEPTSSMFSGLDELLISFMEEQKIPGLSLAISRKGQSLYVQCYGYATHSVPLRRHHMFRIASVSKILTAIAILRLYDDAKLKLNDKIFGPKGILSEFAPSVSGDRRVLKITVKHLLQHSGGWDRDIAGDPVFYKHVGREMGVAEPVPNATLIQYMMQQKLQFTPGTRYAYSNLGYIVLGRVIERKSGQSYEGYVQSILLEIGVTRMQLGKSLKSLAHPDEVEYFAGAQYRNVESVFPGLGSVPAPYGGYCMETGDADGGWIASPTDLLAVLHALEGLGERNILKPATFKLMLDRPSYAKGSCWYGMGLDVSWYRKAWEHGGHIDGATSCLTRHKDGLSWAISCNYWPLDSDYTSLLSYGLAHIPELSKVKVSHVPGADACTFDKKYLVNVKVPEDQFGGLEDMFKRMFYRVSWFDGYQVKGHTYFNIIWVKDKESTEFVYNLNFENIEEITERFKRNGFDPMHIDPYFTGGIAKTNDDMYSWSNIRFAVLFSEGKDDSIMKHALPLQELQEETNQLTSQGFTIKCQSPYFIGTQGYASVLFTKHNVRKIWPKIDLPVEKFQGELDRQTRYGHMPIYLKCYVQENQVKFSGIWSDPGAFLYTVEHNMSKYRVLYDVILVSEKKFHPLCICGYEEESSHYFAAVCLKQVPAKK